MPVPHPLRALPLLLLLLLLHLLYPAHSTASATRTSTASNTRATTSTLALPPVFSDGLVLQTWVEGDARSFVYGTATPGVRVNVTMTSHNSSTMEDTLGDRRGHEGIGVSGSTAAAADPHAAANANVNVIYQKTYEAVADPNGRWSVQLDGTYLRDPQGRPGPKFGPYSMTITDEEGGHRTISDVTYGDVSTHLIPSTMPSKDGSHVRRRVLALPF